MTVEELSTDCPTCGRTVVRSSEKDAPFFPFCCRRCKMVDLAGWFEGAHRIEEPLDRGRRRPPAESPEQ